MADYSDVTYSTMLEALELELGEAIPSKLLIPRWVRFAEIWCERNMDLDIYEATASLAVASGSTSVALPADFNEVKVFYVTRSGVPYGVDVASPAKAVNYSDSNSGIPEVCWVSGSGTTLSFRPKADAAYTGTLVYKKKLNPLSLTNPTNDLLTQYFDLLYYRVLMHAAPYLYEDQRVQVWASLLKQIIAEVEANQWRRKNLPKFKELRGTPEEY